MYLSHNLFYMFIFSFIINMIILPLITCRSIKDISISMNKIYLSIIFGLLMVLSQVYSFDILHGTTSKFEYIIYSFLLFTYIYLFRYQVFIDDTNFLRYIKEKNSSIALISSRKSKNYRINTFSNYISNSTIKENDFINKII